MRFILVLAVLLCSGCTATRFQEGNAKFSRVSFGTSSQVGPVVVTVGADGSRSFKMESLKTEQASLVEAAVKAALNSATP